VTSRDLASEETRGEAAQGPGSAPEALADSTPKTPSTKRGTARPITCSFTVRLT